jgi:hypothetical protein
MPRSMLYGKISANRKPRRDRRIQFPLYPVLNKASNDRQKLANHVVKSESTRQELTVLLAVAYAHLKRMARASCR